MSDEVTFRDFASAIGEGALDKATGVLETLLKVDNDVAGAAARHFQTQMATGQAFMMKAMGMRTVVADKDEAKLVELLTECFGLETDVASSAAIALLSRYP